MGEQYEPLVELETHRGPVVHRPLMVLLDKRADHLRAVASEADFDFLQESTPNALPPIGCCNSEPGDCPAPTIEASHDGPHDFTVYFCNQKLESGFADRTLNIFRDIG